MKIVRDMSTGKIVDNPGAQADVPVGDRNTAQAFDEALLCGWDPLVAAMIARASARDTSLPPDLRLIDPETFVERMNRR